MLFVAGICLYVGGTLDGVPPTHNWEQWTWAQTLDETSRNNMVLCLHSFVLVLTREKHVEVVFRVHLWLLDFVAPVL